MERQQQGRTNAGDGDADEEGWPRLSSRDRLQTGNWRSFHDFMYARLGFFSHRMGYGHAGVPVSRDEAVERKLHLLPAPASLVIEGRASGWTPTLVALLEGTRDGASPLRALRDFEESLLRRIYYCVVSEYATHVTLTLPAQCVGCTLKGIVRYPRGRAPDWPWHVDVPRLRGRRSKGSASELARLLSYEYLRDSPELHDARPIRISPESAQRRSYEYAMDSPELQRGYVSFARCGMVRFPEPADRNVNMMPFIIGDISSLPEDLQCYYGAAIEQCPYDDEEIGRVGYLTVQESFVEGGTSQRRGGLHIEAPGRFSKEEHPKFCPALETISWGRGTFVFPDRFEGGIYFASSVGNTSELWDALVHDADGIVDRHGSCEHLRHLIGPGTKIGAGELVWMTDRTPHQALPQETSGNRQFFRLVTSRVSHWYAQHSTPNPLVPLPDSVTVVFGNKFD